VTTQATTDSAEHPDAEPSRQRFRLATRLGVAVVVVVLLLVAAASTAPPVVDPAIAAARAEATLALTALRQGDTVALSQQLTDHRADQVFAYYFTRDATPRALGDALATAADASLPAMSESVSATSGPTASSESSATSDSTATNTDNGPYEQLLDNLTSTLALATRGTEDLTLPKRWTEDFVRYTTTPQLMYDDETSGDRARVEQDLANKQNLLLLLSRGYWSTDFLVATTQGYWNCEHDNVLGAGDVVVSGDILIPADAGHWPGTVLTGARYAPAPNGTYVTDGMVALMAALTANPEAAGWAFGSFQPGQTTVTVGDTDRRMGAFAHYLFFEREYGQATSGELEGSGASTSLTALASAVRAIGGSYAEDAVGPLTDLFILQDTLLAAEKAQGTERWYQKIGHAVITWGHLGLDVVSMLPGVGAVAGAGSAVWSLVERDWTGAGLSLVTMLPAVGAAAAGVKLVTFFKTIKTAEGLKGLLKSKEFAAAATGALTKTNRAVDKLQEAIQDSSNASIDVQLGLIDFDDAAEFLTALEEPVPTMVYRYGATAYTLATDGTLVHLSGPDQSVIQLNIAYESPSGDNQSGRCVAGDCLETARIQEEQGLTTYASAHSVALVRDADGAIAQVHATLPGVLSPRIFNGLAKEADGTYTALTVIGSEAARTSDQAAFDQRVSSSSPAMAQLNGDTVTISSVTIVNTG